VSKKNNFIERSLAGALSFLKESIFSEEYALKRGLLQPLDPRVKVFTFFSLLILVVFLKNIPAVFFIYLFSLLLAVFSRVNLGFFLKRTWVFIPLFSLFIALPALFNFFTPGETLWQFKLFGLQMVVTRPGFYGALLFVLRVATSVSLVILLSLTTRHTQLLKVLRIFKVPQVFVFTLGLCYRYIYLFIEVVENTYLGIKSRIGTGLTSRKGQHIVAWNIASLWHRSYLLNEEVYKAMLSRGYTGEPVVLDEFKAGRRDLFWILFIIGLIICIIIYLP